jgi:hypothetical protein
MAAAAATRPVDWIRTASTARTLRRLSRGGRLRQPPLQWMAGLTVRGRASHRRPSGILGFLGTLVDARLATRAIVDAAASAAVPGRMDSCPYRSGLLRLTCLIGRLPTSRLPHNLRLPATSMPGPSRYRDLWRHSSCFRGLRGLPADRSCGRATRYGRGRRCSLVNAAYANLASRLRCCLIPAPRRGRSRCGY